jgi:DNA-binding SARP family transcriptional activator
LAVKSAPRRSSVRSLTDQDKCWESIYRHLERGKYEHAISDLRKLSEYKSPAYSPYIRSMIKTALLLCQACIQFRKESDWHNKANSLANSREDEFLQQLHSVLNLIQTDIENKSGTKSDQDSVSSLTTASLKKRLQSLLSVIFQSKAQELETKKSSSQTFTAIDPIVDASTDSGQYPSKQISDDLGLPIDHQEDAIIFSVSKVESAKDLIFPGPSKETMPIHDQPSLVIYCLGPFKVYQDDQQVTEWLSSKGKMVFKYLVTHRDHPIPKEILMDLFWPNTNPDSARNNLNVAIYGLRQALHKFQPNFSHVLYQNDQYTLNPSLRIWMDIEEFEKNLAEAQHLQANDQPDKAVKWLETAINLYHGDFLAGDIYEEWTVMIRERLRLAYLSALHQLSRQYFHQKEYADCAALCQIILARDNCREDVHCLLMRCFAHQGQTPLGLRQYQICAEALREELGVSPSKSTVTLYQQLKRREITKTQSIS